MVKRILATVDTGEHGEDIVPVVAALARGAGSTVRLLRVFPVPERVVGTHGRTVAYVDQEMARLTAEGLADLRHVEADLGGVPVETVVRFGDVAEEITLEAEAFGADLIALGGRRAGRLRSLVAPDVAERVERSVEIPTLVLRG
jgi:nucleotide-binding universal stress UspA family protein